MKFFKKFAAVLIAMAVFTVGNIGILPRDAVEDFMFSVRAADFTADGGFTADEIANSPVKPKLTATKKVITLEEAKESQTIEISVGNACAKYASTGIHVYYDKDLQIEMDEFGDPVASLGAAGGKLTTKVPNIDPTAADFGMEGIFVTTVGDKNYGLDGVLIKLNVKIENPVEGAVYPIDIIYRSNETNEDIFINKEADEAGKLMQAYAWTQGIYNKEYNNNFKASEQDIAGCSALVDIAGDVDGYIAIADTSENTNDVNSGTCGAEGDNLTWTLDSEGTLTISGEGEMEDWADLLDRPWHSYKKDLLNITIENGVTSIGSFAFSYCDAFTTITIPDSVTFIAGYAFCDCDSLTSITIPDSVTSIIEGTFEDCDALTTITIPNGVTSIGSSAFFFCDALTSITIPNSVTSIGGGAFEGCSSLTSVTIPDGVRDIWEATFDSCSSLVSITIPNSVTSIGKYAFYSCDILTDVYYSGTEEEWNNIAIESGNERLYDSDVTIHYNYSPSFAIGTINNLKWALTDKGILTISGSGLMDLDDTAPAPWLEYADIITEVIMEDGVMDIGKSAFEGCTNLSTVKIPDSVKQIGDCAFKNCTALTSIIIPNGITTLPSEVFYGCSSLKEIHIPRSLTLIKDNALYGCKSMTDCYYGGTISDSDSISYSWLGIAGADSETLNVLVIMNWHYLDETYYKDIDENIYEHLVILYNDEYYYGNSQTVPIINDYRNMAIADPSVNSYKFWKNASDIIDGDFNEEQYNEKMTVEAVIAEIFFNEQLNAAFNKNAEQAALEAQIAFLQILKDNAMELGISDEQCSWIDTVLSTPEFIENSKISSILKQIPHNKVSILFNAIAKWYENWKETIDFVGTAFGIFQISYEGLKDSIENVEQLYNLYLACVVYHTSNVQFQQAVTFMSDSIRNEIAKYTGDDDFSKRMRRVGNLYLEYYAVMLDESMTAYNNFATSITSDVLLGTGIELFVFSIKTIAKSVFPGLAAAEFVLDFGVFIWEQRSNIDEQAFARDKFLNMTLFYDSFYNALYSNEGFFGLLLKNPNTESYNTLLIGIQMHQTVESILADYAIDYSVLLRDEVEKCYKFSHIDEAQLFLAVMCSARYGDPDGFIDSLTWLDKASKRLHDDIPLDLVRLKELRDAHKTEGAIVAGVSAIYAVQCPVDITVYRENDIVAKVENDVIIQNCNDVFLRLYHLNDVKYAHKYIMLPDGYSLKVTGFADGTMSFEKAIIENGSVIELSNIEEIPVTAGSVYNEVIEGNKTVALECDLDNNGVIDQTVNAIDEVDAMLGDVNDDGMVDSSDASRVLAEYAEIQTGGAGEFTDIQYKAADVNKDDVVDSSDASKILSYYAMVSTGKEPTWD